jgi:hypothetical protein
MSSNEFNITKWDSVVDVLYGNKEYHAVSADYRTGMVHIIRSGEDFWVHYKDLEVIV